MLARVKARLPRLYASDARRCPMRRAGSMEASEKTYRLYSCARCAEQVRICCECDRGNRYCAGECAEIRRVESVRRAGERYQSSPRGACRHAARQSAWCARQAQKVTHQGSLLEVDSVKVAATSTQSTAQGTHVDITSVEPAPRSSVGAQLGAANSQARGHWHQHRTVRATQRCSFCGCALPAFARTGRLRGGP